MNLKVIIVLLILCGLLVVHSHEAKGNNIPLMASLMLSNAGKSLSGTSGSTKQLDRSKAKSGSSTTVKPVVAPEFMKEACKQAKTKLEYCKKIQK